MPAPPVRCPESRGRQACCVKISTMPPLAAKPPESGRNRALAEMKPYAANVLRFARIRGVRGFSQSTNYKAQCTNKSGILLEKSVQDGAKRNNEQSESVAQATT